jgi:hypothetical protein
VVPIHALKTLPIAVSATFLALIALAPGAAATAGTCLYNASPPLPAVASTGTVVVSAAANLFGPVAFCGGGPAMTSTAAPCTQVAGVPVPKVSAIGGNAWCDAVVTGATIPTAPMQCTVYPPAAGPAFLQGVTAGWDIAGPGGSGPDGNMDVNDFIAGGPAAGLAYSVAPGAGGTFSVLIYPPWIASPTPPPTALAQLIVYPVLGPPGAPVSAPLAVGCA